MKVVITGHGEEEYAYTPETLVNDIRIFAAEKLQLQPTNVNVRKHKCQNSLPNGKTLSELGFTEKDVFVVRKNTRNNEGNAKKKFQSGKTGSSKKYDVSQIMAQSRNNHEENINHHAATHEMFDDVNEQLVDMNKKLENSCSMEKSLPGETHNQSQSRLRIQKNKLCDFIKEHEEEKKVKKQKKANNIVENQ